MKFKIEAKDKLSKARVGEITTDHGVIETPIFMPVGTVGSVKGIHQHELQKVINAEIILGNTYHLFLRPGLNTLHQAGGLHAFIGWDKPILTDSGGYQVYSLSGVRKIKEEGVKFSSHIDGRKLLFTPENAIDTQRMIGADIIMAFDECTPYPCTYAYARGSMELTHRWLKRCMAQFQATSPIYNHSQALFPIVQGSTYKDLREKSAEVIASYEAEGNAIGGMTQSADMMYTITEISCNILPADKPRYLMGVGTPVNILESIALGVDMFDCVLPTRNGRNGMLFTENGTINIKNQHWKNDFSLLDPSLNIFPYAYTKAYLCHLIHAKEMLGAQIASLYNLCFYLWLVKMARKKILEGDFYPWKNKMVRQLAQRL